MSHSIAFPMPLVPFPMPPSLSLHLPPLLCPLFHFPRRAPPPSSFIPSSISRTLSLSPVKFHPPLSLTNPRKPLASVIPEPLIFPTPASHRPDDPHLPCTLSHLFRFNGTKYLVIFMAFFVFFLFNLRVLGVAMLDLGCSTRRSPL